jgi:4-carboxymuconolactone decarboxylase
MKDKWLEKGLRMRRKVLTTEYVNRQLREADDFTMPVQVLATAAACGMVWPRPGLPLKSRSMITIAFLVALDKPEELELHIAGALRNGVTKNEIREILMHAASYCGFPASLSAFRVARNYFAKHAKYAKRKPAAKKSRRAKQ